MILTDRGEYIGTYTPRPRKQLTAQELDVWAVEQEARVGAWRRDTRTGESPARRRHRSDHN
ncbi:hypothetical protein AB5I41_11555 [Sphingomonas sp. MMS24-JH45]